MKAEPILSGKINRKIGRAKAEYKQPAGTAHTIKSVATTLFAEKGFKNTSVKDITDAAQVNIGAINYHFQSKDNLLHEIVKEYTSINMNSVLRTLGKKAGSIDELKLIFEIGLSELFEIANEYRDTLKIIRREISYMPEKVKGILGSTFLGIQDDFIEFFESGKKKEFIREDVDAEQVVLLIYSYVAAASYDEIMPLSKPTRKPDISDSEYRERSVSSITQILFNGIADK